MSKMSELDLTIKELKTAAQSLIGVAEGLSSLFSQNDDESVSHDSKSEEPQKDAEKPIILTFEQVRGTLADKSRNGHTSEIRNILEKYGGTKLSDILPDHYPNLLKDAEELK